MKKYYFGGLVVLMVLVSVYLIASNKKILDKKPPTMILQEVSLKEDEKLNFGELKQKAVQSVSDNKDQSSDIKLKFTTVNGIAIDDNQRLDTSKKGGQAFKIHASDIAGNTTQDTVSVVVK